MGSGNFGGKGGGETVGSKRYATDQDLIKEVILRFDVTFDDAKFFIDQIAESIRYITVRNGACHIRKLGTFHLKAKRRCKFRNPKTQEEFIIPLLYYVRFRGAPSFKALANAKARENMKKAYEIKENKI